MESTTTYNFIGVCYRDNTYSHVARVVSDIVFNRMSMSWFHSCLLPGKIKRPLHRFPNQDSEIGRFSPGPLAIILRRVHFRSKSHFYTIYYLQQIETCREAFLLIVITYTY